MNAAKHSVVELYTRVYGESPAVVARAPGRVEVLGNHTDYNEGYVLSCAIDRDIHVAIGPAPNEQLSFVSTHYPERIDLRDIEPVKAARWVNYPLGVYAMAREKGLACRPFRMAAHGTVPLGAGLSSSAALEVSTALALRALYGLALDDESVARVAQEAENRFAGAQCGLLDQYSSLFGKRNHVLYIDFRTLEHRAIPIPDPDVRLIVTVSGVTHSLAESAYNDRRAECAAAARFFNQRNATVKNLRDITMHQLVEAKDLLDTVVYRRARHVVGENERVLNGARMLERGDLGSFGRLLYESHQSSRANFENSCPRLDTLVDIAASIQGVYGSRLTGGGFGGATLTLLSAACEEAFMRAVEGKYRRPDGEAAETYSASIADGAEVLDSPASA